VSLRCFTFSDFQITPTIEEYGEILRIPVGRGAIVYHYLRHLPTKNGMARMLGVSLDKISVVCPSQVQGIQRKSLEDLLKTMAIAKDWPSFNRILALLIYGIVIFLSSFGVVSFEAVSVFQAVEHYRANRIPAILAETFMSLTKVNTKIKGRIRGCLPMLNVWIFNHI